MNTNINFEQLEKDALEYFTVGKLACSESVIYAIRKNFEIDLSDDAIAMSGGFPWGLGGAGCICGALAGGTMMIGYFFGRREPGDPVIQKCFKLTNELHDAFKAEFGAACCRSQIIKYGDRNSPERKCHCIEIVKFTVRKTAEIILSGLEEA